MHNPLSAGAGSKLELADVARLGSGWVVQPKLDGIYAVVTTDRTGRIGSIITRAGEVLGPKLLAHFSGVKWTPSSVLVCEVELWTEAANRAAQARGYRMAHVFDVLRLGGRDLSHEPYSARREALMRAESALVNADRDRPWIDDTQGDAHDTRTGRYKAKVPHSWRRISVVPQLPISRLDAAWAGWVERGEAGPCEGLVAVRLDAQLGRRNAKRKCKPTTEIDVVITALEDRTVAAYWTAASRLLVLHRPKRLELVIGAVVEVTHEGFHDSGDPRFARITRVRRDLTTATVARSPVSIAMNPSKEI